MARREVDRINSGQMHWRGELENNCRKPKNLTKNRHSDSLKMGQLLIHSVWWKMEMMMKMIWWEPVCHKTERQGHCVLQNFSPARCICICILLSTYNTSKNFGGEGNRWSTRHSGRSQLGSHLPWLSWVFRRTEEFVIFHILLSAKFHQRAEGPSFWRGNMNRRALTWPVKLTSFGPTTISMPMTLWPQSLGTVTWMRTSTRAAAGLPAKPARKGATSGCHVSKWQEGGSWH